MSAKKRKLRTWSEFGEIHRRPTEYEIGTHAANYTMRKDRLAALEQNPSSPGNLWFLAYRDNSPLQLDDWEVFRDPDQLTYRAYVAKQAAQETKVAGLMDSYASVGHDQSLSPEWVEILRTFYTPIRYPAHAIQMLQSYVAHMAPSAYITNAAALSAADQLRRVTVVSIRTRELQLGYPDAGFATGERGIWEGHEGWQPTRELLERALIAYDWGEAITAANLVIAPTLDDVLNGRWERQPAPTVTTSPGSCARTCTPIRPVGADGRRQSRSWRWTAGRRTWPHSSAGSPNGRRGRMQPPWRWEASSPRPRPETSARRRWLGRPRQRGSNFSPMPGLAPSSPPASGLSAK